jgi:hypothetical protein
MQRIAYPAVEIDYFLSANITDAAPAWGEASVSTLTVV